jgi:ribosomal protein L7/L12
MADDNLDDELRALLAEGRKIEAIKRYREATGADLAAAKEAVEALERGEMATAKGPVDSSLEAEIVSLLEGGKKIEAVKIYRERTGMGLKEAKDAVEAIAADHKIVTLSGSGCLGAALFLENDYDAAVVQYHRALRLHEEDASFHSNHGTAYFMLKKMLPQ